MLLGRGWRLLLLLAAALAVFGLHAYGASSVSVLRIADPQDVIAAHVDVVAGTVALRTETLARDDLERPVQIGPLLALGACAIALLAAGHHRRGVVLSGAARPLVIPLASSSPRAPPLRVS
jgi:hypothetical protein